MEKLFTYGSLQHTDIQKKLFDSILLGKPDSLVNYQKDILDIDGKKFNIAKPSAGARIDGTVYELTESQIERADRYEGKNYERIKVKLLSGTEAWLYLRL
jgi:gamma-glutamylcyclotransferase (GGCT)/AIG2-like uncharacterized protein YtfP